MATEVATGLPLDNTDVVTSDEIIVIGSTDTVARKPITRLINYINTQMSSIQRTFGVLAGNIATWAEGNNVDIVPIAKLPDYPTSKITNFNGDVDARVGTNVVRTVGNQTVDGIKNFTTTPTVNNNDVLTQENLDILVTLAGAQTITGDKTLTGATTLGDTTLSTFGTPTSFIGSISNALRFTDVSRGPSITAFTGGTSAPATIQLNIIRDGIYRFTEDSLALPENTNLNLSGTGGVNFTSPGSTTGFRDSSVLDDYQTGFWVAVLPAGLTNIVGTYTKIGNAVQIYFTPLSITGTATTPGDEFEIGGLPFAVNSIDETPGVFHSSTVSAGAGANTFDGGFTARTTLLSKFRHPGSQATLLNSDIGNLRNMTLQVTYSTSA